MELKLFNEIPRASIEGVIWDPEAYEKDPNWETTGPFKPVIEIRSGRYVLVEDLGTKNEFITPLEPGYFIIHSTIFGYEALTPREFENLYVEAQD